MHIIVLYLLINLIGKGFHVQDILPYFPSNNIVEWFQVHGTSEESWAGQDNQMVDGYTQVVEEDNNLVFVYPDNVGFFGE